MRSYLVFKVIFLVIFIPYQIKGQRPTGNCQFPSEAKGKSLLYYVENENSGDYFVPIIEKVLRGIKYTGSEVHLYDTIRSLNVLNENRSFESSLFTYFTYYDGRERNVADSKERYEKSKELADFLLNGYDRFLKIKINPMPNDRDMEFQFWMFDVAESEWNSGSVDFKVPDLVGYSSSSALLSLDLADHEQRLIYALKKVNPEANTVPEVALFHGPTSIRNGQELYVHVGDTLNISTNVIDRDSEEKSIQFRWISDKPENIKNFKEEVSQQEIILVSTDPTRIELVVTDGICESKPFRLTIIPINIPQLYVVKRQTNAFLGRAEIQAIPNVNINFQRHRGVLQILYSEPLELSMSIIDEEKERFIQTTKAASIDFKLISKEDDKTNDFSIFSYRYTDSNDNSRIGNNYSFKIERRYSENKPIQVNVIPEFNQVPYGVYSFLASPKYHNITGGSQLFRVNISKISKYHWGIAPRLIGVPISKRIDTGLDVVFGYQFIPRFLDSYLTFGIRPTGHFNWSANVAFTTFHLGNMDIGISINYQVYQLGEISLISILPDLRETSYDESYDLYTAFFDYSTSLDQAPISHKDSSDVLNNFLTDIYENPTNYEDYKKIIEDSELIHSLGFGIFTRHFDRRNANYIDFFVKVYWLSFNDFKRKFDEDFFQGNSVVNDARNFFNNCGCFINENLIDEIENNPFYYSNKIRYYDYAWNWRFFERSIFKRSILLELGASFNFHFKKK